LIQDNCHSRDTVMVVVKLYAARVKCKRTISCRRHPSESIRVSRSAGPALQIRLSRRVISTFACHVLTGKICFSCSRGTCTKVNILFSQHLLTFCDAFDKLPFRGHSFFKFSKLFDIFTVFAVCLYDYIKYLSFS